MSNNLRCVFEENEDNSTPKGYINNVCCDKLATYYRCTGLCCTWNNRSINVITNSNKEKEVLFDIINHLYDPILMKKYLIALKNIVLNQQLNKEIIKPFDMTDMSNKEQKSETTMPDLQIELQYLKKEAKKIKQEFSNKSLTDNLTSYKKFEPCQLKLGETSKIETNNKDIKSLKNQSKINKITKDKAQSYHIPITLVINKNNTILKVALLDT